MGCNCNEPTKVENYLSKNIYTWCTNCGNYGIFGAMCRALVVRNMHPCETLLCFDIGCHGNGSDKIDGYRFHGLHGRVLPFAAGASIANEKLRVIAFGGDGGTFAEGVGHLVSAVRGNYNVTFIFHNNLNYGLTQGQASPTTRLGMKRAASPDGPTSSPIHAVRFVLGLEPSYVARTFSGDIKHMTETFSDALQHKGFSFVEVFQSCPTYNKETPHEWYQERVYDVRTIAGYDATNLEMARKTAEDLTEKIAVGTLYKDPNAVEFVDRLENRRGMTTQLVEEVAHFDTQKYLGAFL